MAKYGLPYMGSKQAIADDIVKIFPKSENFYDLFGGGFSISHAMLIRRSKDFKHFHYNEMKPDVVDLVKRGISGEFNYEKFKPKFIDRKEFFDNLNDPYIRCIWSFGNNQKTYLFSEEIEPYKKSMHNSIVFNEFDDLARKIFSCEKFKDGYSITDRRLLLRNRIEYFRLNGIPDFLHCFLNERQLEQLEQLEQLQQLQRLERLQQLQQLQQLQRLEQLERLQQLQQLQQLQRLSFSSLSYDKVEIKENSIIYCDPPYKGTADYQNSFNTEKFLDWADAQNNPVFISEYEIKDKRFKLIKEIKKRVLLDQKKTTGNKIERIYLNQAGIKKFI